MATPLPLLDFDAPAVPLTHLDHLWFQVGGTLCNLACHHCFISCSPGNRSFGFLDLAAVKRLLDESVRLGVKEYYFTGGEPFLNKDIVPILERTLRYGPATVLTNGTVFKDADLACLRRADEASPYSLEFRLSLDGYSAVDNDALRGAGTFERILRGLRQLLAHDFLPIITVAQARDQDEGLVEGFIRLLREQGYERPRLKILPILRIGAETERHRGYQDDERVTGEMMADYDAGQLLCSHSRIATDRGVFVCPILIEAPDARLGGTLEESLTPYPLRHHACYTCYQYGALCANASSAARDA
jgi:MoaA/NifB/PqqE/SkfB family radical SAM enzyme